MKHITINLFLGIFTLLFITTACEKGKVIIKAPPKPLGFKIDTLNYGTLHFFWEPSLPSIDSFRFYKQIGQSEKALLASLPPDSSSYFDYDIDAKSGKNYRYILQTIEGTSYSEASVIDYFPIQPKAPYNIAIQLIQSTILNISWDYDEDKFTDGIIIDRKNNNGYWVQFCWLDSESRYYNSLAPVGPVYFRIRSSSGNTFSNPAYFPFRGLVPPVDSLTGVNLTENLNQLTWRDNSEFEDGYYIHKGYGSYANLILYDSVAENTEEYLDYIDNNSIDAYYGVVGHYNGQYSTMQYVMIPGVQ